MDAFEGIVKTLLEHNGFWVKQSVKVNISKEKKLKKTSPRVEIDLVAYKPGLNKLFLIEVKSYLFSKGVILEEVQQESTIPEGRYKLLTSTSYQEKIKECIKEEFIKTNLLPNSETEISFWLVAGKVHRKQENELREYISKKGWEFWGPTDIKQKFKELCKNQHHNDQLVLISKLFEEG